jgi:hypothetical protein
MRGKIAFVFALAAALFGCADRPTVRETEVVTVRREQVVRGTARPIERISERVVNARDALDEAQAIRDLQQYMKNHKYTYTFDAFQLGTNRRLEAPSTAAAPVRAQIKIYNGQQKLYEFSYIPKENENIPLIAPGS